MQENICARRLGQRTPERRVRTRVKYTLTKPTNHITRLTQNGKCLHFQHLDIFQIASAIDVHHYRLTNDNVGNAQND
jgi:hypothetical protein